MALFNLVCFDCVYSNYGRVHDTGVKYRILSDEFFFSHFVVPCKLLLAECHIMGSPSIHIHTVVLLHIIIIIPYYCYIYYSKNLYAFIMYLLDS